MRTYKIAHKAEGAWRDMFDHDAKLLRGIKGSDGVRAIALTANYIGADFIRIEPGCGFDLHAHPGDHILYIISGAGVVHFAGDDVEVLAGHVMHIPAEYPHAVRVPKSENMAMVLLAVGHPHRTIGAVDRSHPISENHAARNTTPPAPDRSGSDSHRKRSSPDGGA